MSPARTLHCPDCEKRLAPGVTICQSCADAAAAHQMSVEVEIQSLRVKAKQIGERAALARKQRERDDAVDAQIAAKFDPAHTLPLTFADTGNAPAHPPHLPIARSVQDVQVRALADDIATREAYITQLENSDGYDPHEINWHIAQVLTRYRALAALLLAPGTANPKSTIHREYLSADVKTATPRTGRRKGQPS